MKLMVADNNDDVKLKLDEIEEKVNRLLENMDKKKFNVPDKIKKEDKNNVGLPEEIDLPKKK